MIQKSDYEDVNDYVEDFENKLKEAILEGTQLSDVSSILVKYNSFITRLKKEQKSIIPGNSWSDGKLSLIADLLKEFDV